MIVKKIAILLLLPFIICGCTHTSSKTELNFSTWGTASEIKVMKELINDYETLHPDIKINLIHIPQNYFKKLHLMFASKSEPDIILINNQNITRYREYLLPLDKKFSTDDFFSNAISGLKYKNSLKAVPRDISVLVIYYNKTLLNKYNIPLPEQNWTMNDFLNIAEKLKSKNIFAIPLEDDIFYLYPFIVSSGENPEQITAENMSTYKSVLFYKNLSRKYHYAPEMHELGTSTGCDFFIKNKSAFLLSGRWMTPKLRELAKFEWDILPFPSMEKGSVVVCDTTGWGISKRTKYIAESIEFVNYLSSEKALNKIISTGIIVPARKDNAYSNLFLQAPPDNAGLFITLAQTAAPINYPANYDYIKDKINNRLKGNRPE